jgi:hypothetical protein
MTSFWVAEFLKIIMLVNNENVVVPMCLIPDEQFTELFSSNQETPSS